MATTNSDWLTELHDRFHNLLWQTDEDRLPAYKAWPLLAFRLTFAVSRDVAEGQLTLRAMSLVYTTLLSLVPLLAISFSVLKGFGVHNQVEPLLLNLLAPLGEKGIEVTERIIDFVDNVKVGVLGFIGFAMLFYTVVSLMQKMERSFNYIWQVTRQRTFAQRVRDYLSVVVIGPALVVTSFGITASVTNNAIFEWLVAVQPFGWLLGVAGRLVPFFAIAAAFAFIYLFVPNTTVRPRAAIVAGLIAGVMWNAAGWAFAAFVGAATNYTAIYSTFATLILFLIWLYLGWLILLIGASISFYYQHPEAIVGGRDPLHLSNRLKEKVGLAVVALIARCFEAGDPAPTTDEIARRVKVPPEAAEAALDVLERNRIVARNADAPSGFLPARPPEKVNLIEVLTALRSANETERLHPKNLFAQAGVEKVLSDVDANLTEVLKGRTVKDLIAAVTALDESADPKKVVS